MNLFIKNFKLFLFTLTAILIGISVGIHAHTDFSELYPSFLTNEPTRYLIILAIAVLDYLIYTKYSHTSIIFRYSSFFKYCTQILKESIFWSSLYFLLFNFIVLLTGGVFSWNMIVWILPFFITQVLISVLITVFIHALDLVTKKRFFSIGAFIILFAIIDFLLQHYNFNFSVKIYFDVSYMFILPSVYESYPVIWVAIMSLIIFILTLTFKYMVKRDFFLKDEKYEEN